MTVTMTVTFVSRRFCGKSRLPKRLFRSILFRFFPHSADLLIVELAIVEEDVIVLTRKENKNRLGSRGSPFGHRLFNFKNLLQIGCLVK